MLLVHAGGEDAEMWRPVAERLPGSTVVTYDRRGTGRSGRDDWPGRGSSQHADDAAALLEALGLEDVLVFGASSGGIPALVLALRHPALVRRALIFEPGYFRLVPGGDAVQGPVDSAVARHLARHPADWEGAFRAFKRSVAAQGSTSGVLSVPPGNEWYAEREVANAEALVRDDLPILTGESVDEGRLSATPVDIRFSFGSGSRPIFRAIATRLSEIRGREPDRIDGVGHLILFEPDRAAAYIRRHL